MKKKRLVAKFYLKDGLAIRNPQSLDKYSPSEIINIYNDMGVDELIIFDLSTGDAEHEKNLHALKEICTNSQMMVFAGGNIKRFEDVKKILYAGCQMAIIEADKEDAIDIAMQSAKRFGKVKQLAYFKSEADISKYLKISDYCIGFICEEIVSDNLFGGEYIAVVDDTCNIEEALSNSEICAVASESLNDPKINIRALKDELISKDIDMDILTSNIPFSEFKLNSDGLIPVIAQDYMTDEVLMLAYMNEEAYNKTLKIGKMTYYSRSRQKLWTKGEESGHFQYVRSLTLDCDNDTILAKVHQIGSACHTGNRNCFFNKLVARDDIRSNPLKVLDEVYDVISDRKVNPKEGSYTNYLFDKGVDKILKKVGEEAAEIIIAAKNPENEEVVYEISDFLYHVMVLMAQKEISWQDVMQELARR